MLQLKPKQQQVLELVNDSSIHTIVLIGSVGTGKTDISAHISISIAYTFPKTYWLVVRKNISTAKKSVIPSYLEMLDKMNLTEGEDFTFNRQDFEIEISHNNSRVVFVEADFTKDRQGRKIKGINATGNHIDEADEIEEIMFVTATSRRGRRNEQGQPSLSIITMNPNSTYLKEKYYDPWKAGKLPKGVAVVEFTLEDSWQTQQDIDAMLLNPRPWRERYLYNNWAYEDDLDSLFKYRSFDAALTDTLDDTALRTVGYDVARSQNGDRSVAALWYGKTLVDISIIKDNDEQMTTDDQALELIKYMTTNSVIATNINVDAVGIGVGVVDHMKSKGIFVSEFIAGGSPADSKFNNLRSEVIYNFARGLEKGEIKIYSGCPFRNELVSEAMLHLHKTTDKQLAVEGKEEIKKRTGGKSPDIFDAVCMGLAKQLKKTGSRIAL